MYKRTYINEQQMLKALEEYEQFLEGHVSPFTKKLFFLLAAAPLDEIRKLASIYPLQTFSFLCFTWRTHPENIFSRDPRFFSKRKVTQHELQLKKPLPLFTAGFLDKTDHGQMIAERLELCKNEGKQR